MVNYVIQKFVLDAFGLGYLQTIAFILVITLVQMVEIILKKVSPALYQALGVFLSVDYNKLLYLGCDLILVIQKNYDLLTGVVYAFSTALVLSVMIVFAGIREQLSLVNIPKGMRGMSCTGHSWSAGNGIHGLLWCR